MRRWTRSLSDLNATLTRSALSDVVKHEMRTRAECTQFLCAGRAGFPEILQIFRAIFAQNLRHLDAGLAHYLAFERTPTRKRAATKTQILRKKSRAKFAKFPEIRHAPRTKIACTRPACAAHTLGIKLSVQCTLRAFGRSRAPLYA